MRPGGVSRGRLARRDPLNLVGRAQHHRHALVQLGRLQVEDGRLAVGRLAARALDDQGRSPWAEKYPPKWFAEKRRKSGLIIFNAQYQCDTEAMKGEIFQYDDCQRVEDSEIPNELRVFMGIDLAISEKEAADKFAVVVVGVVLRRRGDAGDDDALHAAAFTGERIE